MNKRDCFPDTPGRRRRFHGPTPPAGWLKGRGACGIRAIPPGRPSRYSSATAKAGCSTNRYPCRASPTDITVSRDGKWLAVIYTAGERRLCRRLLHRRLRRPHTRGDVDSVGVAAFNGVAIQPIALSFIFVLPGGHCSPGFFVSSCFNRYGANSQNCTKEAGAAEFPVI